MREWGPTLVSDDAGAKETSRRSGFILKFIDVYLLPVW